MKIVLASEPFACLFTVIFLHPYLIMFSHTKKMAPSMDINLKQTNLTNVANKMDFIKQRNMIYHSCKSIYQPPPLWEPTILLSPSEKNLKNGHFPIKMKCPINLWSKVFSEGKVSGKMRAMFFSQF